MKGVGAFFKKYSRGIIMSLICCIMLFVGIGYASITRDLKITGDIDVDAQEGIFITTANYADGKNVSAEKNSINECYSTIFNADVELNEFNEDTYVVFDVTIYNGYTIPYRYSEAKKIDSVYTNDNIVYEVLDSTGDNLLNRGEIVQPDDYISLKIKFKYSDSADLNSSNHHIANVCVNLDFNAYIVPELTDNMIAVEYNETEEIWKRADENSFNYSDYDNGVWANAVTYNHTKAYSQNEYTTNGGTWFDGSSYYINYRHENESFGNRITAGVRFKWTGEGSGSLAALMCNISTGGFGLFVSTNESSGYPVGTLLFRFIDSNGQQNDVTSNTLAKDNAWHTFIVSYDTENVKLYINGVLDKTVGHTENIKSSPVGINIGRQPPENNGPGGTLHLLGNVSHIALAGGAASDEEARRMYETRFSSADQLYDLILNLDITSRDSNGKYFDGLHDGGYNMGLAGHDYNQSDRAKFSVAVKFNAMDVSWNSSNVEKYQYFACCLQNYGYGFGLVTDVDSANTHLYFSFYNEKTNDFIYAKGDDNVSDLTWYTAVVTVDGSYIKMYLDGREQVITYKTHSGASYTPGSQLKLKNSSVRVALGGNPNASSAIDRDWYNGWIKECVIFKKALSKAEIDRDFTKDFDFHYKKYSTSPSSTDVLQYVKCDYDNVILQSDESYTEEGVVLNGEDDYISVGLGNHNFSSSLTFAIRLKFPAPISTETQAIVSNFEQAGFKLILVQGRYFRFSAQKGGTTSTDDIVSANASSVTVQPDTWYTVTCVVTDNGLRLYINGEQKAYYTVGTAHSFVLKNSMHPILIGADPGAGTYADCANIVVSDFAFINQEFNETNVQKYFVGEIEPDLARANCYLNFVGYQYRKTNQTIPEKMINGYYVWIPRYKIKSMLDSGEMDIEFVSKETEAHDAFTFGEVDVSGFWFSKFDNTYDVHGNIQCVPYVEYNSEDRTIAEIFYDIKEIETSLDKCFTTSEQTFLDIHMVKSSEWGAMAYLSRSRYGLFLTGEYAQMQSSSAPVVARNYKNNQNQSTNQHVTGIYCIYGGPSEFVMGNFNNTIGTAGFTTLPDAKYFDVYTTADAYFNSNLQHGLGEYPMPYESTRFVDSEKPWFYKTNLFTAYYTEGNGYYSSRTAIFVIE